MDDVQFAECSVVARIIVTNTFVSNVEELRWQVGILLPGSVIYGHRMFPNKDDTVPAEAPVLASYDMLVWSPRRILWETCLFSGETSLGHSIQDGPWDHSCCLESHPPLEGEDLELWVSDQLDFYSEADESDWFGDKTFFEQGREVWTRYTRFVVAGEENVAQFLERGVIGLLPTSGEDLTIPEAPGLMEDTKEAES